MEIERFKIIKSFIKNKLVLDIGFLGENKKNEFSYLHLEIQKFAKEVWGLDVDKKRLDKLKKQGYNVVYDDAQKLENVKKLGIKFDVVVAGEIIEHLENPGLFLDNVKKVLKDDGILIITTPNMLSLRYIIRHIIFSQESPFWHDRDKEIKYGHVIGFSRILLENLLLRKNYKIIFKGYTIKDEYKEIKGNLEKLISKIIHRFAPSLIFICKVKK